MPDDHRPAASILQNVRILIDAVIFDIGDVLEVNPATGWQQRWSQRLGLRLDEFERRLGELWAQGPDRRAGSREHRARDGRSVRIGRCWASRSHGRRLGGIHRVAQPELVDYFRGLRPRCKTAILSNSFVGAREREQDAHQLSDLCDLIVYSHEEGCRKPDPQIYRIVCQRLGIAPGMNAIRFHNNTQSITELDALLAAPGA
jgi:FMN phosphatase YigB (HAD superfamily)